MPHRSIPGTRGRVRPITLHGTQSLHTPCEEVPAFTPELASLVEDLFATMYAAQGVGLAANQVGELVRVFVYDCPDDEDLRHVGHIVNPQVISVDGVVMRGPEGCLSLPGLEAGTERYDETVIEGYTVKGAQIRVEGTGFFARCLQHEMDHLEGSTYVDRLEGWRRKRLLRQVSRASWSKGS
ncbi:peptide deformylase [Streptomyces acidiscabies]|uniref:peptide deformylase n=1 Tax=Streptomyces acidiscabies TaxID=42234 RepID=UPI00073EAECB|nr:peptide deformylase [Streptomyces acidiscabies]GAQ55055.1 peptide deformylase [Streptomyces acidiscabies]